MRTPLNLLVTERILSRISENTNSALLEMAIDDGQIGGAVVKNVCAKVSVQLSDKIDEIVSLLGCSKRKFLEAAFLEAVDKAELIIMREGFYDAFPLPKEAE